jgi:hypothetical protein
MTLTRQCFELIAQVLREEHKDALGHFSQDGEHAERLAVDITIDGAARRFARELARTNPNFDGHLFLRACGIEL